MRERLRDWKRRFWDPPECAQPGCESLSQGKLSAFCPMHLQERIRDAAQEQAERQFEYDVAVRMEAERRMTPHIPRGGANE